MYNYSFGIFPDESMWPENPKDECCQDPGKRRDPPSCPKSSRIHTKMDMRERGHPKRCSICRTVDHSKNKCPNKLEEIKANHNKFSCILCFYCCIACFLLTFILLIAI